MKKFVSVILAVFILFNSFALPISAEGAFSDVRDKAWYKPYVDTLYERNITKGYQDGTFKPDNTISVAEFIAFTLRALGYNDLKGADRWYDRYVAKAEELNIISRYEYPSYRELDRNITRQEMAKIIANALSEDIPDDVFLYQSMIKDFDTILYIYQSYVLICYAKGIINGTPEGYFNPGRTVTRAEAAKVIINLIEPESRQVPPEPEDPNAIVVEDSSITLDIAFDNVIESAWIHVEKGDQIGDFFYKINSDRFNRKIYLPFGPGKYEVTVYISDENTPTTNLYPYYCEYKVVNKDTRDMKYLLPSGLVESDSEEIINLAGEITKDAKNDMERIKLIHKWVATNIAYDTEAYFSGNSGNYSALETLHGKKAVCNGYARLTAALCRAVGIRTKIISGVSIHANMGETWDDADTTRSNHAWNEVFVDGRWVVMDTTWDAGYVNFSTHKFTFRYTTQYFDPSEEAFAVDHLKLSESEE